MAEDSFSIGDRVGRHFKDSTIQQLQAIADRLGVRVADLGGSTSGYGGGVGGYGNGMGRAGRGRSGPRRAYSGQMHPACRSSSFAEPQVRYVRSVYSC